MAAGPRSHPLYNLLLFQFKQRARSPSSGGPRGPGRAGSHRPAQHGPAQQSTAQPDAFVYYGSTRRAGRRPGSESSAPPALVGPGRVGAPGRVSKARVSARDTPPTWKGSSYNQFHQFSAGLFCQVG